LVSARKKDEDDRQNKEKPESSFHSVLPEAGVAVSSKITRFSVYEIAQEKSRFFELEAVRF
jgi:hypothetical protein